MTDEADVIEQSSREPLRLPARKVLIAIAAALAVAAAGAFVAVARPWSQSQSRQSSTFPDPCRLLPAATLAKYVPGATVSGPVVLTSTIQTNGECAWTGSSGQSLLLDIDEDATAGAARRGFDTTAGELGNVLPAGRSRTVTGLGDQARAVVAEAAQTSPTVDLVVRSGASVVAVNYSMAPKASGPRLSGATVLADAAAIVRAALGDYATAPAARPILIAAVPSGGPRYGRPANACSLLIAAAVARYLGGTASGSPYRSSTGDTPPYTGCAWKLADGSSLLATVSVFSPGADGSPGQQAQQHFEVALEGAILNGTDNTENVIGSRDVPAVGSYAGAALENGINGGTVALYAWSGNAEISVTLTAATLVAPDDAELSCAIAAARDVFTNLPRASGS